MSRALDAWLRSAAFLEFMHQWLRTATTAKRLYDQWAPSPPTPGGAPVRAAYPDLKASERE